MQTVDELSGLPSEASVESCMQQLSQAEETAAAAREDAAALRRSVQLAKADVDTLRHVLLQWLQPSAWCMVLVDPPFV